MNRLAFLTILHDGLAGLPERETDDILADYMSYFDEAQAAGRSEDEVAAALGDPRRLARELRAESGLRRWENHRSLGNSAAALLALGGLAAVDVLVMLPLLFAVTLSMLVIGLVIVVPTLVLIWRIDPFRVRRSLAVLGAVACSAAITVWALIFGGRV